MVTFNMEKILLVGGGGYIGTIIARYLSRQEIKVVILDNLIYGHISGVCALVGDPNIEFVNGDMGDRDLVKKIASSADKVVFLAGLVGDPITKKYPTESHQINDIAVISCLETLQSSMIDHLIFVSTCSNYGLMGDESLAIEDSPLNPLSAYASSKVAAERWLLDRKERLSYRFTILRFATAFGVSPRMRFDLTVNEFAHTLANGRELVVFDADTWRPYCHVNDFAELVTRVFRADHSDVDSEVFNAGSDRNNATKRSLVEVIRKFLPDADVVYQKHGSDPRNYRVDFSKVRECLGFEASVGIEEGVQEVIQHTLSKTWSDFDDSRNRYGNYALVESSITLR